MFCLFVVTFLVLFLYNYKIIKASIYEFHQESIR